MCSKVIIKYPTNHQIRHYTTLWNVCAQKWPCSRAEWSKLPCKTQTFETIAENIYPILLAQFRLLAKSYLQWSHWKTQRITSVRICSIQEKRCHNKTLCIYDQHSNSLWWHQSASHKLLTNLILVDHGVKVTEGYYFNVTCYYICCYLSSKLGFTAG